MFLDVVNIACTLISAVNMLEQPWSSGFVLYGQHPSSLLACDDSVSASDTLTYWFSYMLMSPRMADVSLKETMNSKLMCTGPLLNQAALAR